MTLDLNAHAGRLAGKSLKTLAEARAGEVTLSAADWVIDMSRQRLDEGADAALLAFGAERGLEGAISRLFDAEIVNPSEGRSAMHWALRTSENASAAAEEVRRSLHDADEFAARVHAGEGVLSEAGTVRAVVHVGIGGSDFGPRLIADSLGAERADITLRFCANLDPYDLSAALEGLDPASTLVVGVSKSFGTEETLYNLSRARDWLRDSLGDRWTKHMALVTANPERANAWLEGGAAHLFHMPETIGGRFSLWSAASISCACVLGTEAIAAFRAGASLMDEHVRSAPLARNAAARLALLDYWNASILGHSQRVVLAYARRLRMLPTYLQQLEMESNGKSVTPHGEQVSGPTAPALWGGEGSIGQHSYHQWLHQGTQIVPTEFILAFSPGGDIAGKRALAAHALAQAEVLANGRSLADVHAQEPGLDAAIAAQKVHGGDRPSTFMIHSNAGAGAMGALIALYEHRTYLAGCLWGLNPFDQWGVERGKTMAATLKPVLLGEAEADDPVTSALAAKVKAAL